MTTEKMKREAIQTRVFRHGQAECNARPPAHWFDFEMAKHKTRPFAFFGVRNFIDLIGLTCGTLYRVPIYATLIFKEKPCC